MPPRKTRFVADGARCYPRVKEAAKAVWLKQCCHMRGKFNVPGRVPVNTGKIDILWRYLKEGLPKTVHTRVGDRLNPAVPECVFSTCWRYAHERVSAQEQLTKMCQLLPA